VSIIFVKRFYSSWRKHFYPSFFRGLYSTVRMRVCRPAKVDYSKFTMGNPMPESALTLCQSRLYSPVRGLGFGLRLLERYLTTTGIGFSSTTEMSEVKWNVRVKTKSHSLESFFYNPSDSYKKSTFPGRKAMIQKLADFLPPVCFADFTLVILLNYCICRLIRTSLN